MDCLSMNRMELRKNMSMTTACRNYAESFSRVVGSTFYDRWMKVYVGIKS